jgi:uncharacterized protein YggE
MNGVFSTPLNRALVTVALVGLVAALGSYAYVTLKNAGGWVGPTTINIVGTGEVTAVPDIATFSFSVRAEGKDAAEAQGKSAESMNKVIGFLKDEGVDEKDIKTTGYNLMPKYTYTQAPCAMGSWCPPGEQKQDGFEVYQTVTVKVRDTKKAGTLLSGVGERGATDMSSLGFTIDDEEKLKAEARELAIADAKEQAEALARQLGVRLGEMTGYYEESANNPYPYYGMGGDMMMSAKAEAAPVPEMPAGENTIMSRVNLTYTIK